MLRKLLFVLCVTMLMAIGVTAQGDQDSAKPTATGTTAEKAAPFRPSKDQVMQGQKLLKEAKLYTGEATGVYNDDTRAAIRIWQKNNGIPVTGNFNRATLEKMGIALTDKQKGTTTATTDSSGSTGPKTTNKSKASGTTKSTTAADDSGNVGATTTSTGPKRPAPFRADTDQIKAAQKLMIADKMYAGDANGTLDDSTRDGLKKYQEANKIKVTGTLNAETLNKMGIILTDKQKAQVAAQAAYDASKSSSKQN